MHKRDAGPSARRDQMGRTCSHDARSAVTAPAGTCLRDADCPQEEPMSSALALGDVGGGSRFRKTGRGELPRSKVFVTE